METCARRSSFSSIPIATLATDAIHEGGWRDGELIDVLNTIYL